MNKRTFFFIGLMLFIGYFPSQAQYKYLRYTDLEKWKTLSHAEKIEASQIPLKELESMPTQTLLELCLSYPLFSDIYWNDDHVLVFSKIKERVNVFQAFYKRQDAGQCIINIYKESKPENIAKTENRDNVPYVFLFNYLDIMSGQPEIVDKLNSEQRMELLSLLAESVQQRINQKQYYSSSSFTFSAIPMFRILEKENKILVKDLPTSQRINSFLVTGNIQNWEDISLILTEGLKHSKANQ